MSIHDPVGIWRKFAENDNPSQSCDESTGCRVVECPVELDQLGLASPSVEDLKSHEDLAAISRLSTGAK
jgi:hypothetical protein